MSPQAAPSRRFAFTLAIGLTLMRRFSSSPKGGRRWHWLLIYDQLKSPKTKRQGKPTKPDVTLSTYSNVVRCHFGSQNATRLQVPNSFPTLITNDYHSCRNPCKNQICSILQLQFGRCGLLTTRKPTRRKDSNSSRRRCPECLCLSPCSTYLWVPQSNRKCYSFVHWDTLRFLFDWHPWDTDIHPQLFGAQKSFVGIQTYLCNGQV